MQLSFLSFWSLRRSCSTNLPRRVDRTGNQIDSAPSSEERKKQRLQRQIQEKEDLQLARRLQRENDGARAGASRGRHGSGGATAAVGGGSGGAGAAAFGGSWAVGILLGDFTQSQIYNDDDDDDDDDGDNQMTYEEMLALDDTVKRKG